MPCRRPARHVSGDSLSAVQCKIPRSVRTAILNRLADAGLPTIRLADEFLKGEGYGNFGEVLGQVRVDHGDAVAEAMDRDIREIQTHELAAVGLRRSQPEARPFMVQHLSRWAFVCAPDPVFTTVLGYAFAILWQMNEQSGMPSGTTAQIIASVNDLFAKRGVPYRVTDDGDVRWHGEEKTYTTIIEPALAVLADLRLAGARSEYEDALRALRGGTQKQLEDAIEESAKAVESVMKVLADESSLPRTGKETARPLINMLAQGGVIPAHVGDLIFAAARIRNAAGGHGTGGSARVTPEDLAAACVAVAGVAITYLGNKLP